MGEFDARIFGIHSVTPMSARIMPAIGVSGINGHKMMRARLIMPPSIIIIQPTIITLQQVYQMLQQVKQNSVLIAVQNFQQEQNSAVNVGTNNN